jgi:hypothetical protein
VTYEKTADDLEQASHLQEQLNLAGRKASEAALAPQTPKGKDGQHVVVTHCVEEDCGEELPPVRVVMKRIRCTVCQIALDKRQKLGRV